MWLPVAGLLTGLLLGFFVNIQLDNYAVYLSVGVMAALNSLAGGTKAQLQNNFDDNVFLSGFLINVILGTGLAFLGVQLGVDLYLAAVFALTVRLFHNSAIIRRILLGKWSGRKDRGPDHES